MSSSWLDTGNSFDDVYGSGTANGEYITDNFDLGGSNILLAQQFGLAYSTTILNSGLLGMGPGIELTGYPTVIDSLADQGLINSPAFSLSLGNVDTPEGKIFRRSFYLLF